MIDRQGLELCLAEAIRYAMTIGSERLSIILVDNMVDLMLADLLEPYLFADRFLGECSFGYQQRIDIYKSFPAKVAASVKLGMLNRYDAETALIGHQLRNRLYHTGVADSGVIEAVVPAYLCDAIHLAGTQFYKELLNLRATLPTQPRDLAKIAVLLIRNVIGRVAFVVTVLDEHTNCDENDTARDSKLDAALAHAENIWGREFIEKTNGTRPNVRANLTAHNPDVGSLPQRILQLSELRKLKVDADRRSTTPIYSTICPWWRKADRQLALYEGLIGVL
jgi:hypothetical protein